MAGQARSGSFWTLQVEELSLSSGEPGQCADVNEKPTDGDAAGDPTDLGLGVDDYGVTACGVRRPSRSRGCISQGLACPWRAPGATWVVDWDWSGGTREGFAPPFVDQVFGTFKLGRY
jgi:hypothetical protein